MVNNKANKKVRVREQKQEIRDRAKELMDMWRMLTDLDVEHYTVESALLNSPDFNYYEKLMLYLIHKHAVQAEKSPNTGDKHERENDMVILERHTAWLINNSEQIREQETAWSDVVSSVLQRLHMCALVADNGGPCWLTYDAEALDSSLLEAVRHLEKDGLIFRKHSLYKATRHRWPALELHAQKEEMLDEMDDTEEESDEESILDEGEGGFSTAEEAEAAQMSTMADEQLQERLQQSHEASKDAAAQSDFYAAAAADAVTYRIEQELARRQEQHAAAQQKLKEHMQALCADFKDKSHAWSTAAPPGQRCTKPKVSPSYMHVLQGIFNSVLSNHMEALSALVLTPPVRPTTTQGAMATAKNAADPSTAINTRASTTNNSNQARQVGSLGGRDLDPPELKYAPARQMAPPPPPPASPAHHRPAPAQRAQSAPAQPEAVSEAKGKEQGKQLLQMLQGGGNGGFVGGVHRLSEVEPPGDRSAAEHDRAILQQQQQQQQPQQQQPQQQQVPPPMHHLDHWPELGSQDTQPTSQQTSSSKMEGPPPDWQPVFARPPSPPRISLSRVRSRAVDVRCVLEAMVYRGRGAASHRGERYGMNHVFRDTLKMDTRLGVYQKLRMWVIWKELSHKCHEDYGSTHHHHTQARLEKDLERIDAYEAWLVGHVLEAIEDTEVFGTREAFAAATADRTIALEEACSEVLLVLDAAGGVASREALQLQLMANEQLTLGRWERANALLTESLHLLAYNELINFQYTGCRELVRSRPHSRNLSRIHMATNAC